MAAYTFAALFLAHVVADYLLQTRWLVMNKRRPLALGIHVSLVLLTMMAATLSFNPWFVVLTAAHLGIDVLKTFVLRDGFVGYLSDQLLHIVSIIAIALIAPEIWRDCPLAEVPNLPVIYMMLGGVIFAARGGQYAVETALGGMGQSSALGVLMGWAERTALCVVVIGGWPLLVGVVLALKLLYAGVALSGRDAVARRRLALGTVVSLLWGLATAVPLAYVMPIMQ